MKKMVLFASGNGSNVENIIQYFQNNTTVSVAGVFSNNLQAKVLEKAKKYGVPTFTFDKKELAESAFLDKINTLQPDLIVLAGFLLKFPEHIIAAYPNKIINIHPALLPQYGGKGMYGMHVHKAVLENNEKESGITIHYVNEYYDEGEFILQQRVNIESCQTPQEIAEKVQSLEYDYFPKTIETLLK